MLHGCLLQRSSLFLSVLQEGGVVSFRLNSGRHFLEDSLFLFSYFCFVLAWVATCAAAPLASFSAYFFSRCVQCHVIVSASYRSVPLEFHPDSFGCLGRPLKWRLFFGCVVVSSSTLFVVASFIFPLLVAFIDSDSVCHGFDVSWLPCCFLFSDPASSLFVSSGLFWVALFFSYRHIYVARVA